MPSPHTVFVCLFVCFAQSSWRKMAMQTPLLSPRMQAQEVRLRLRLPRGTPPPSAAENSLALRLLSRDLSSVQFSSVQFSSSVVSDSLQSHERQHARPPSLSVTNSQSPPKPMSVESVMPSNHLILCRLLLLPSIFPSISVFSNVRPHIPPFSA